MICPVDLSYCCDDLCEEADRCFGMEFPVDVEKYATLTDNPTEIGRRLRAAKSSQGEPCQSK